MRALTSKDFLDHLESIFRAIPWGGGHYHDVGDRPVQWKRIKPEDRDVIYQTEVRGTVVEVPIKREHSLWGDIHYVAERYQEAGLLCEYNYVPRKELLRFEYLPVVRFWGRAQHLIHLERERRGSPFLWYYVEQLGSHAWERHDSVQKSRRISASRRR